MFQITNVLFLNTFDAILNIMDANACVLSVEFIYSVLLLIPSLVWSQYNWLRNMPIHESVCST